MSGPKALGAVGFAVPLNIFLFQEIARMQNVFNIVRKMVTMTKATVIVCNATHSSQEEKAKKDEMEEMKKEEKEHSFSWVSLRKGGRKSVNFQ